MNSFVRNRLSVLLTGFSLILSTGCLGSDTDLAEEYNLDATADQRTPAKTVASIIDTFLADLTNRENSDPASSVAMLNENLEGFEASQFGDQAAEFEKIKAAATEMQALADKGATRAEFREKASALETEALKLAGSASPE